MVGLAETLQMTADRLRLTARQRRAFPSGPIFVVVQRPT